MKIHDISVPLSAFLPVYPGDPSVELKRLTDVARGDEYTLTTVQMTVHAGTHVDAPLHFIPGGAAASALDLGVLMGPARVVEMTLVERSIGAADLMAANVPEGSTRLLFKTKNSRLWERGGFQPDFVGFSPEGARWLVERGVRLVGIDYVSIDPPDTTRFEAHRILLDSSVIIVEGLCLKDVSPGAFELVCLPLRIEGTEASPARAVLLE